MEIQSVYKHTHTHSLTVNKIDPQYMRYEFLDTPWILGSQDSRTHQIRENM